MLCRKSRLTGLHVRKRPSPLLIVSANVSGSTVNHDRPGSPTQRTWRTCGRLCNGWRVVDRRLQSWMVSVSSNAPISTGANYRASLHKQSAAVCSDQLVSEWQMLRILHSLHATATGLGQLSARYLRIGASIFCKPLVHLFNLSATTSTAPRQWKTASIQKVSSPNVHADFRPISIASVLTQMMERIIYRPPNSI